MCGIAGVVALGAESADWSAERSAIVTRMLEAIAHRGPDGRTLRSLPGAVIGCARLAIVDREFGWQPFESDDGNLTWVVNGEIYNHVELRNRLSRGHNFRSTCDAEVVGHLYAEVGDDLARHLDGQFAFALHDRRRARLILARDKMGICPIFFAETGSEVIFSSEAKAILWHPDVSRQIDLLGLDQVLSLPGLVSPRTMFVGVQSLPPGHLVTVDAGLLRVREHWDLDYPMARDLEPPSAADEDDAVELLSRALSRAVIKRLQGEADVGCYLSGGVDSALLASFSAEQGITRRYSVAFEEARLDESGPQDAVAAALGGESLARRVLTTQDVARQVRRTVAHAEVPFKESYNVASFALSKLARELGSIAVLAGEGADELFAGYSGYRFDAQRAIGRMPPGSDQDAANWERLTGAKGVLYHASPSRTRRDKMALLSNEVNMLLSDGGSLAEPLIDVSRVEGRHRVHQRSYLDVKLRLGDHLLAGHGDRMAMASSVEARYPYLDDDVVDLVRTLHPDLVLRGLRDKFVLRTLAARRLPRAIAQREKFPFAGPTAAELVATGDEYLSDLVSTVTTETHAVFDPRAVRRLRDDAAASRRLVEPTVEVDWLMVVITTHALMEEFGLSV